MAKNKAQLQLEATQYRAAVTAMWNSHGEGQVLRAIEIAMSACDQIDGMLQFEKRFEDRSDRKSVETFDYVLRYAPLAFDRPSLDRLAEMLKSQKRIEKNTTDDLAQHLQDSFVLMWDAHRLWSVLEQAESTPQDKLRTLLGGDQERWRRISEDWEKMGLIERTPERGSYRLSLATRIAAIVRGKCRSCGATGKAAMGALLEEIACPKCKTSSMFVFLTVPTALSSET
jgi:hypothetical protein